MPSKITTMEDQAKNTKVVHHSRKSNRYITWMNFHVNLKTKFKCLCMFQITYRGMKNSNLTMTPNSDKIGVFLNILQGYSLYL